MGKRKFAPLPQTVREQPGQKFRVVWRNSGLVRRPGRDDWDVLTMPHHSRLAENLTKQEAEAVLSYWQGLKDAGMFEHAIQPQPTSATLPS